MSPIDPDLTELLERSADRSVLAVDALRGDVAELRRVLDRDREAASARMASIERQIGRVDARCAALVIEEDGPDGSHTITARPARVGLDVKFVILTIAGLVTAALTSPVVIELLK